MSVELARFLRDVNPRHVAVCFDVDRNTTFRRMMDPNYKSHRKPYPDDIVMQVRKDSLECSLLVQDVNNGISPVDTSCKICNSGHGLLNL